MNKAENISSPYTGQNKNSNLSTINENPTHENSQLSRESSMNSSEKGAIRSGIKW
jgi:hypothetical protein